MTGYSYTGNGFVIENNVVKGKKVTSSPETNGKVGQFLLDIFQENPDHVGQIEAETGKTTTYSEMRDKSIRCALWLMEQNLKSGDVVSLCCDCQTDSYIPFLSTFYVGAVHNAWDIDVAMLTARRLMQLIQPKVMFCLERVAGTLEEAAKLEGVPVKFVVFEKSDKYEYLDSILNSRTREDVENFQPKVITNMQDYALLMFSSGSTGFPKGILHTYHSFEYNLYTKFSNFAGENSVNMWYSTPYWMTSTIFTLKSIIHNSVRVIHKNFDPEETIKCVEKYKVNWMWLSPTTVVYLSKSGVLASKRFCVDSLRVIMTGGGKVSAQVITDIESNLPNGMLCNVYGSTEAGAIVLSKTPECKIVDSMGFIFPEAEIKIIDDSGKTLGPNEPGEMLIRKPAMSIGYYKNPEETKNLLDDEGWIHSGDKVLYDENGEFRYIERLRLVMKFQGHHVSPTEIEDLLSDHPGVLEVAVLPLPHEVDGDRPVAFVKRMQESEVTEDDLIKLSYKLGRNKRLSGGVVFVDDMPHTSTGKISKPELKLLLQKLIESNKIDLNKVT